MQTEGTLHNSEATPTEAAAPVVVDQNESPTPAFDLDDLMGLTSEDNPLFTDDAQYKGIRPINEYLHHLPEDLQKNLANLRAMATRKTQELAKLKAELESEKARVLQERELIVNSPVFKKLQEVSGDEPVDIWSEEGLKKAAQQEAAKLLQETFAPLKEQLELEQAQAKANNFVAQHPDAKDDPELKSMIVSELQRREDLSLEDAYWLCKGRLTETRQAAIQRQAAEQRAGQREALTKTSTGAATGASSKPKFRTAEESIMYHMQRLGSSQSTK